MGSPTLGLRIGAVFILFCVSALGCLTPYLFIKGRKHNERRKQTKHSQPAAQEQLEEGAVDQSKDGAEKKHKHHAHLEAFHTTRAMHLLKAFSAGASATYVDACVGPSVGNVASSSELYTWWALLGPTWGKGPFHDTDACHTRPPPQASSSRSASCTCWRRRRLSWRT